MDCGHCLRKPAYWQPAAADFRSIRDCGHDRRGADRRSHRFRWREQLAIQKNRPKRWMLKDEDLIDIARFKPATHKDLSQIGNLSADYVKKNGDAILKVIKDAAKIDPSEYPKLPEFTKLNTEQQAISDCLMAICRVVVDKNQIALASVTTKKEIDQLVAGKRDSKICSGWRHEMIGKYLLEFINGEISLSCVKGRLEYTQCS